MAQKNLKKFIPLIDGGTASKYGVSKMSFIPTDTEPTAVAGVIYFDDSEDKFKMCTDGSTWTAIVSAGAATTGLDGAYDLNNTIAVDGSAVTFTATSTTNDTFQINSAVATGAAKALVDLVWTGTPNATANMLRLDASGATVTNTPYIQEFLGNAKDIGAIYIDTDAATDHQVYLLDEGNVGAGKSQLYIDNNGTPNATGTLLTLDATGATATNTPYAAYIKANGVDFNALWIDSDSATDSCVLINGGGAIANNKAVVEITADGTPANAGSNVLRVDGSGMTATNNPIILEVVGTGKDLGGLVVDADGTATNVAVFNGGGNLSDGNAVVSITADGGTQTAGGCLLVLQNSGTPDTDSRAIEIVGTGVDMRAMYIDTDSATNDGVYILNQGNIASGKAAMHIDIDGTPNAAGFALLVEGTGATMSGTPYLVKFDTSTKDAGALYIDTDAATDSGVVIHGGGATANNTAVLEVNWDGTPANAGSNLVRIDGSGGTNTVKPVLLEIYDDSVSVGLSVDTASIEDVVSITGSGNTGANKSVVDINWGAVTPNAAGNLLRLDATAATTTSVPIMFEIVGAGEVARAIYSDVDCTGNHANLFHCGGALTNGYGVVGITNDGNLAAGGNLLNVTMGGTPADATVCAVEIVAAKNCLALDIASSAVDAHAVQITGSAATADNKSLLHLIWGAVTPVAGSNILRVDGTAITATGVPSLVEITGAGKTVQGLNIDADCTTVPVVLINGGGALANGQGVLNLTNDGNLAAGGNLLNITMGGTPADATVSAVDLVVSKDCLALDIVTSAATTDAVRITGVGAIADNKALLQIAHSTGTVASGGSLIKITGATAATAGAYGMTIDCSGANFEALWVEAGAVKFAETLEVTGAITASSTITVTTGVQSAAVARTATADGTGTGTIAAGTTYVTVTAGGDANSIIILPAPVVGNVIWLYVGATGYELRSSTPASIAINGGTGAAAESAVGANTLVRCVCTSATTWVCNTFSSVGTEAALEAAA